MHTKTKILIVDDSATIVEMLKVLMQRKSYQVLTANNGLSGLNIAILEKPEVVVLDLMLPQMNGYNVCRKIKEHADLKHTKVILFTVKDDQESRELGVEVGADAFISKGCDPLEIAATIDSLSHHEPA